MKKNGFNGSLNNAMRTYVCIVLLLIRISTSAQTPTAYSLDSLQQMARNRYPLIQQLSLATRSGDEAVKNVKSNWLPKASYVGSATYQSEVTEISLPASMGISMESPAKTQYKTGIELSQLVFDAGLNSAQETIEELNVEIEKANIETNLLKIKSSINNLFTAILVSKEAFSTLKYVKSDLIARHKNIKSATESGTVLNATKRELEAEIAAVDQNIIDNRNQLISLCTSLSFFVQEKLDTSNVFILPNVIDEFSDDFSTRPEYKLYATQLELSDWREKIIRRSNLPKLALFGNGYYGRPGLNFFNNDFRLYGMAGVNLSWNIGGIYSTIHQRKQLEIGKEKVDNQKKLFALGIKDQLASQKQEIIKLKQLIEKDNEITAIRSEVKDVAVVQYENGTITTTDYVLKLNAETKAMISNSIHKIQLTMAYINYKTLLGK